MLNLESQTQRALNSYDFYPRYHHLLQDIPLRREMTKQGGTPQLLRPLGLSVYKWNEWGCAKAGDQVAKRVGSTQKVLACKRLSPDRPKVEGNEEKEDHDADHLPVSRP